MTENIHKIDRWFPISAVDEAVSTPHGSGRSEKALLTWFASRPIAQARAAVLTALLPDVNDETQRLIDIAVRGSDAAYRGGQQKNEIKFDHAITKLASLIEAAYDRTPVLVDPFSGRGIIPLEGARLGVRAIGIDLAPLATLAGRLLAEYPQRNWSHEPDLPSTWYQNDTSESLLDPAEPKLVRDVDAFLREIGRRLSEACSAIYPKNPDGSWPWGYLWAVTITCDSCSRRFPLIGSLVLRHPHRAKGDPGQWLRLVQQGDEFLALVEDGTPDGSPTFVTTGGKKAAYCFFCGHPHSREVLKRKGFSGEYQDRVLVAAENNHGPGPSKVFRELRDEELTPRSLEDARAIESIRKLSAIPDEQIPPGNNDTVRAAGYGYKTFGSLMTRRQAEQFAITAVLIRGLHQEVLTRSGISEDYATALAGYAAATLVRRVRRATRGSALQTHGNSAGTASNTVQTHDIYSNESKVSDGFDFFECGPGTGPGSWDSIRSGEVAALRKVMTWPKHVATPGQFRQGSATSLPLRDASVDVIVTDPPYYNMIDYSDASDLLYVWARRALFDAMTDLFGAGASPLQPKDEEIIVKRSPAPGDHRTVDWYHRKLSEAFSEMRRVLRDDGHLTVVFGHHDPDAWLRLLGALHEAGFVVTASWPSRTETTNTGVASIRVTVSIGCRVAPANRPEGLMSEVDLEVRREVLQRVQRWSEDGLALPDQLMAAYGPAMEVYGRYSGVYGPAGEEPGIERYLLLARGVVKEASSLPVDQLPLEAFDAQTRLGIFWLRFYGLGSVPKGEARFMAQTESIRLEDVRELLSESRNGLTLDISPLDSEITATSSVIVIARVLAHRWVVQGTEGAASVLAEGVDAGVLVAASDVHLWAVVSDLVRWLPQSNPAAKALAGLQRARNQVVNMSERVRKDAHVAGKQEQLNLGGRS